MILSYQTYCLGYSQSSMLWTLLLSLGMFAQSPSLTGTVRDASGEVRPGAAVSLFESRSTVIASVVTNTDGGFALRVPRAGEFRLRVTLAGFEPHERAVRIDDDMAPSAVDIVLDLAHFEEQVSVVGTAIDPVLGSVPHGLIDRQLIGALPSGSVNSSLSSLLTLTTPGVAADSNGVFHPLGEHAETSFAIDNQPVSDQQSRIFSNQLSPSAIQSIEVLSGAPPAEFGDKTSLVALVKTRSGLDAHGMTGSASVGFGSFRTPTLSLAL